MFHTPTFENAVKHHHMVKVATQRLGNDVARQAWNALTGRDVEGELADAIELTMPEDYFPLLRGNDGVPACFALAALADHYNAALSGFMLRAQCASVWTSFEDRRKRANDVAEGLGWDLSDAWLTERDVDDVRLMEDVAAIARLAGRMYEHIKGTKIRTTDGNPEEVESVTIGGDISRLIPSELAQLVDDDFGDMTAIRVVQKRALEFQFRGDKPAIRGPLVIVIDESGSMGSLAGGGYARGGSPRAMKAGRNQWAKACAAALTRAAHDQGRLVRVVHFSTVTNARDLKPGDAKEMVAMMRHFLSGGNDINMALNRGIREVGDLEEKGFKGADIVLISDGEDGTDHQTPCETMAKKGIKLWSASIEVAWDQGAPLVKNAAKYIPVSGNGLSDEAVAALKDAASRE